MAVGLELRFCMIGFVLSSADLLSRKEFCLHISKAKCYERPTLFRHSGTLLDPHLGIDLAL